MFNVGFWMMNDGGSGSHGGAKVAEREAAHNRVCEIDRHGDQLIPSLRDRSPGRPNGGRWKKMFCRDVTRRSKGGGGRSEARERGKSHQVVLRRALKRPNGRQMAKSS